MNLSVTILRSLHTKQFVLSVLTLGIVGTVWAMSLLAEEPKPAADAKVAKPSKFNAEELRKKFPFESIVPRLEYEKKWVEAEMNRPAPKLSEEAEKRLKEKDEREVPKEKAARMQSDFSVRSESLRLLHSDEVEKFISRNGFGISRMPTPSPYELEYPQSDPIPFVKSSDASAGRVESERVSIPKTAEQITTATKSLRIPPSTELAKEHHDDILRFTNTWSNGYVKDREHVAGFQSHQFHEPSELIFPPPTTEEEKNKSDKWKVASLELVSLLKHEKPAVYVSENLPRMDDLKTAKTRKLNEFEAKGLETLRTGEDVVADGTLNRIVMVGAIRASKSCLECHYVQRGELLGAFSYDLFRDPPLTAPATSDKPVN